LHKIEQYYDYGNHNPSQSNIMRSLFVLIISVLVFIWLVSKCGGPNSETAYSDSFPAETEQKLETSPEATRARILAAEKEKTESEALKKQELLE